MKTLNLLVPLALATTIVGCSDSDNRPSQPKTNSVPVAAAASVTTETDTELNGVLTGTDADGDALVFGVASEPTQGTLMLDVDGSFTYLPNETVTGTDQFTFTVSDGRQTSMAATVDIVIDPLQLSFSEYSRAAFSQAAADRPLPVNGRAFEQDVTEPTAYDDLLQ